MRSKEGKKSVFSVFQVSMIPLVPPIALLLSKHPIVDKYDLSSVKCLISSAAPLSLDIMENLRRKFGWDIVIGYGLTECTLATHFTPKGKRRFPSVGVIMPYYEGKVENIIHFFKLNLK